MRRRGHFAALVGDATSREGLAAYTPTFHYLVTELRATPDSALGNDDVALVLKLMKHAQAPDFLARFASIAGDFALLLVDASHLRLLTALVHYLLEVRDPHDTKKVVEAITLAAGPEAGAVAMNAAEQLRQEGLQEGRQEAEVQLLARMLSLRFGGLDPDAWARLERSTFDERAVWIERLLSAPTLEAVFEPPPR